MPPRPPSAFLSILRGLSWAVFACMLMPAAWALELDAAARAYLAATPQVTVGVISDNEPYSSVGSGGAAGFSIDVLEEVAARTELQFRYRAGSWPEIYPAFLRGEIDVIDEISFREDRAQRMLFTAPYHYRQTAVMHDVGRPLAAPDGLAELKARRVGVVRDIYYKSALQASGAQLVEYDGLPSLIRALAFGWVDAIVGPEVTLRFLARQAGYGHLAIAGGVDMGGLEVEDFRLAVLRGNETLHRILEAGLAEVPPERLADLLESWQEYGGQALRATKSFRPNEQQAAYVRRLGPVRVGVMRDYAPFSFVDGGKVQGLAVDVLERVADLSGLQVVTVADRWTVLFDLFQRGEIDIIANISDHPSRREFTRFTAPYHVIPNVVFTRDPGLVVERPEDLNGLRIALGAEVFYEGAVKQRYGDAAVGFSAQSSMFQALAEGSVDVVLAALPNGQHWVRELGLTDVRVAGELRMPGVEGEDLRFGVRPALEPLARILDDALAAISPTERRTIENRWLGASAARGGASDAKVTFSAAERDWLAARGAPLRVCAASSGMPLEGFDQHGRYSGVAGDFVALFEERSGVGFEFVRLPNRQAALAAARAGDCDLLPMLMQDAGRQAYLDFTTPYYTVPVVLLARIEAPFVDSLAELDEAAVAVMSGHASLDLLRTRYPRLRFVEVASEVEGLRRVQRGELYGYVGTLLSAGHYLQELGLADIKVVARVPGDMALAVATRKDEPLLAAVAQKWVDSLGDEDRRRIEARWRAVRLEQRVDYALLWQVAGAAALVLGLLFVWNRKLGVLNRRLEEANGALARMAVTDGLTGVGNRKYFDEHFENTFRRCQRHGLRFVVAMVDVDHFKRINDSYGHQVGDDCLQALGACLRGHLRRGDDHVARFGGEEFVVFSLAAVDEDVAAWMETLRQRVAALEVPAGDEVVRLTVSVGVADGVPADGARAADYLARADQALYEAKRAGRNRCVRAPLPD